VKIHLVDGTYELFRSYYGAPRASAPDGAEVGAARGLLATLLLLLREEDVTHVGVAFDHTIESFRNELFGGYNRYTWAENIWQWIAPVPLAARTALAAGIQRVSAATWRRMFDFIAPVTPKRLKQQMPVTKLLKMSDLLNAESREAVYQRLISHWKQPLSVVTDAVEPSVTATDASVTPSGSAMS